MLRKVVYGCLLVLCGGLLFVQGYRMGNQSAPASGPLSWPLLDAGWQQISRYYVDPTELDRTQLEREALRGLVNGLRDRGHTRYLSPSDAQRTQEDLASTYSGIGVQVEQSDGAYVVVPYRDSPAQKAGVQAGDAIIAVDGTPVAALSASDINRALRGDAGTPVAITLRRESAGSATPTTQEVRVTRAQVSAPVVTWSDVPGAPGVVVVYLTGMGDGAAKQLREAFAEVKPLAERGIVLDLRGNPGGYLAEFIDVASLFIDGGTIGWEVRRDATPQPIEARPGEVAYEGSLVVLVNRSTASAGELLAGALRDRLGARVVGERTAGAGTILDQIPLYDGSKLLLATAYWQTPDDHIIWKNGVGIDVAVSNTAGQRALKSFELSRLDRVADLTRYDAQLAQAVAVLRPEEVEAPSKEDVK